MTTPARRLWTLYEPIHAIVYFTDEARVAGQVAGYKGYWMAYFAFRVAPLGPVGAAVATAACYGFHPSRARRALPDAWGYTPPAGALDARLRGVDAALSRLWGEAVHSQDMAEAADLAWSAAQAADTVGRVLGAGNQALPRPDQPHLALWQATTTLREHRGDGHNAILLSARVGPVQAHLLKAAADETDLAMLRTSRNWDDDTWSGAETDLRARGWLDGDGRLTDEGAAARDRIEDQTDQAAALPWQTLGPARTERFAELLHPLAQAVIDAGAYPLPSPIGAPAPTTPPRVAPGMGPA